MHRHNRHGVGNIDLEIDNDNENYINIDYLDRNNDEKVDTNTESISTNLGKKNTNVADISSNLGKIDSNINAIKLINKNSQDNSKDISTNSGQINTNKADISSNLSQISVIRGSVSTNSRQISTNKNDISSNLGKINNIAKTIMLKNIYFTNFDLKDESFSKTLLSLNNKPGPALNADIHRAYMKYYSKKGDVIEIDCKLMFQHSKYSYSDNTLLYYDLYEGILGKNENTPLLFRETRRYNQFSLINIKNRVITYNKSCYKVKYDMDTITFNVMISAAHPKMTVDYSHYIVKNGLNYVSIKHYGKS